jgi:hypothetical protein
MRSKIFVLSCLLIATGTAEAREVWHGWMNLFGETTGYLGFRRLLLKLLLKNCTAISI